MFFEGDGAFGIPAKGETWCSQYGAFFLKSSAIGEHDGSIHIQAQKLVIAKRIDHNQAGMLQNLVPQSKVGELF